MICSGVATLAQPFSFTLVSRLLSVSLFTTVSLCMCSPTLSKRFRELREAPCCSAACLIFVAFVAFGVSGVVLVSSVALSATSSLWVCIIASEVLAWGRPSTSCR